MFGRHTFGGIFFGQGDANSAGTFSGSSDGDSDCSGSFLNGNQVVRPPRSFGGGFPVTFKFLRWLRGKREERLFKPRIVYFGGVSFGDSDATGKLVGVVTFSGSSRSASSSTSRLEGHGLFGGGSVSASSARCKWMDSDTEAEAPIEEFICELL